MCCEVVRLRLGGASLAREADLNAIELHHVGFFDSAERSDELIDKLKQLWYVVDVELPDCLERPCKHVRGSLAPQDSLNRSVHKLRVDWRLLLSFSKIFELRGELQDSLVLRFDQVLMLTKTLVPLALLLVKCFFASPRCCTVA